MNTRPRVIGLTGNIATGKSTVSRMLEDLGACVIDADQVAHRLMRVGSAVHKAVVDRFGPHVLAPDGEIDRQKLGEIVFSDPAALRDLDALTHPRVREEVKRLVAGCRCPVVVVEAIKLLESGMHEDCDAVWVVTAPRAVQVERLMQRSGLSQAQAELRVDAQGSQEEKAARADIVIANGGSLECTRLQVERAWWSLFGDQSEALTCS